MGGVTGEEGEEGQVVFLLGGQDGLLGSFIAISAERPSVCHKNGLKEKEKMKPHPVVVQRN